MSFHLLNLVGILFKSLSESPCKKVDLVWISIPLLLSFFIHPELIKLLSITLKGAWTISKSKKSFFHEQGCYPHQLEFDHKGIIVGSIGDLIGPVAFSSLCANEKLIKSDIGLKISKAFEESKKWVQNSDSKIVAESVKSYFPNFDTTSISNAVKDYQDLGTWNKGINISDEEYNKAQEVFKFSNLISKDYKIEDAVLYAEE